MQEKDIGEIEGILRADQFWINKSGRFDNHDKALEQRLVHEGDHCLAESASAVDRICFFAPEMSAWHHPVI
jgi:hypothetical protein